MKTPICVLFIVFISVRSSRSSVIVPNGKTSSTTLVASITRDTTTLPVENGNGNKAGCNVKNGTCVPTREELIAAGVSNVDMMQHKVEFRPEEFTINESVEKKAVDTTVNETGKRTGCNVKNSTCVPTREELIAAGVSNVDMMQHKVEFRPEEFKIKKSIEKRAVDSTVNETGKRAGCNVKNSTCVPTREELIAAGVNNVDMMQHKIEFRPEEFKIKEYVENKAVDTTVNETGKRAGCNVKNSTCVPTREELIAAGVSNVDMMQNKVEFPPEEFKIKEYVENKAVDTTVNETGKRAGCNVKNSTCVPTREELIAAGVSNVDMMQHKVEFRPEEFTINESVEKKSVDTTVNETGKRAGCNVKNSTCVPTREELIAAGVSNVDMMQNKVEFRPEEFKIKEYVENKSVDTTVNETGKRAGCNVKNSPCVPTREELIAAGVSNVDMMQHKVEFRPEPFKLDENVNRSERKEGCNVKNSTCVPTEKELVAAGVNTNEFVGQFGLDNENIFLGQFKRNDSKSKEALITTTKVNNAEAGSFKNDSNTLFQEQMGTGNIGNVEISAEESTETIKSATAQQIPAPGPTTQQTKSVTKSAADVVESNIEILQQTQGENNTDLKGAVKQNTASAAVSERTTSVLSERSTTSAQTTAATTEFQTCPKLTCPKPCKYGRKVDSNGCEICECKFSDDCPRVLPASRLLCLLQVRTTQGCSSNSDCRRNRICCPGTCGPTCRRASRSRSMLLSMLND